MNRQTSLSDTICNNNEESSRLIKRAVKIGCLVNVCLMALKLGVGTFGHSDALVADGFHSLNDIAADLIMLFFVGLSFRTPDNKFPYGYGKFQTFASFAISSLLLLIGILVGYEAVETICSYYVDHIELERPDIWTLVAILFAMCCKEGLFHFYSRTGKRAEAPALIASAWHHRSDALASVATLAGVACGRYLGDAFRILDPIVSLLIALLILAQAFKMLRPAFFELMERSLPETEKGRALQTVAEVPGVRKVEYIRSRRSGHNQIFDICVAADPLMTVQQSRGLTLRIENAVKSEFCPHAEVSVQVNPFIH